MWKSGDRELKRNAKYWNADNVWLDGLVFYETSNGNMAHDWYESGSFTGHPAWSLWTLYLRYVSRAGPITM